MDPHYIQELITAILRELSIRRLLVVLVFSLTSLTILSAGLVWPQKYTSDAVLYVDERNIIKPLLEGQAEVQDIDQAREAKEKIYTRRILEKVAIEASLLTMEESPEEISRVLNNLRGGALGYDTGIQISNQGRNYISLSYSHEDPQISFDLMNALIAAFIRDIDEQKRKESQEAYDFIESQVAIYKEQLKRAEENLKQFNANNRDGSEESVNERISQLRSNIEEIQLNIDELTARYSSISSQLASESEFLNVRFKTDVYREKIGEAQSRMDTLLLTYTETYPDVIALSHQIEDLKQAIIDEENREYRDSSHSSSETALNPLFEELRSKLADTEVELTTSKQRLRVMKRLLSEEYSRSERIASRKADLTDLTRDYNVTRDIYEDMLGSKEKARLSMTLDIEGQGISYKVHEPPIFPLTPTGLTFEQFVSFGLLAGIFAPLGLLAAYIILDPRIRLPSDLSNIEGLEILAVIPPVKTALSKRLLHNDFLWASLLLFISLAIYIGIAASRILGII